MPQNHALAGPLSIARNVLLGRLDDHGAAYNMLIRPRRADRTAATTVLACVGLNGLADHAVESLSGGQIQRVALARALYRGGGVLIRDEPLSAVDPYQATTLAQVIATAFPTVILDLHDTGLDRAFATRLVGLRGGKIVLDTTITDLAPRTGSRRFMHFDRLPHLGAVTGFVAVLCLPLADLQMAGHDPWQALARMAAGFLRPDFGAVEQMGRALALTIAFAVAGVALGGVAELIVAPFYRLRAVRFVAIALRSVYELFWALMLMQIMGIGAMTGVLAIARA